MCTTGEDHMICSVYLNGQFGKLKGPFQSEFSLVITFFHFHSQTVTFDLTLKPYCLRIQDPS
jgi:hypothetical protein